MLSLSFRQYLLEIKNPPWEGLEYYHQRAKELRNIEEQLVDFDKNWARSEKLIRDFYGSRNAWYEFNFHDVPYWLKKLATGDLTTSQWHHNASYSTQLQGVLDYLPHLKGDFHEQYRQLEVIIRPIQESKDQFYKGNKEFFKNLQAVRKQYPDVLNTFEEQKEYFKGGEREDEDYPTYKEGKEWVDKSVKDLDRFLKYAAILFDIQDKTKAWLERRDIQWTKYAGSSTGKRIPNHRPIEVLYHATMAISKIQKEGLKSKKATKNAGLGGGSEDLLSFTSSLRLATEIAKCIKEITQISKGQIKYDDIIGWARQQDIDVEKLEKDVRLSIMSTDSPEDKAIRLYRHFLYASKRYNPVFFGVEAKYYKDVDLNDIGVIAATVDMSKVQEYLDAEEEFRITPDAMLKIVRVYRV